MTATSDTPTEQPAPFDGDIEQEGEIQYEHLSATVARNLRTIFANPPEDTERIASIAVTVLRRSLRVMSARQLAVWLAATPNHGETHVIHEPPRYTAEQIAAAE